MTGAYGFVGTNLCRHLASRGIECDALDLAKGGAPYTRFFSWDELDAIDFARYAAVVHLAGKAHDLKKVADEKSYFDVNVGLLKKVFERAEDDRYPAHQREIQPAHLSLVKRSAKPQCHKCEHSAHDAYHQKAEKREHQDDVCF